MPDIYIHIQMILGSHRVICIIGFISSALLRLVQIFTVHLQPVYCNVGGETDSFQILTLYLSSTLHKFYKVE